MVGQIGGETLSPLFSSVWRWDPLPGINSLAVRPSPRYKQFGGETLSLVFSSILAVRSSSRYLLQLGGETLSPVFSSVQFSHLIDWVVAGVGHREQFWGAQGCPLCDSVHPAFPLPITVSPVLQGVHSVTVSIQHFLCRSRCRPFSKVSTLWQCPSSISSADHGVARSPRCPEGWFWSGFRGVWQSGTFRVSVLWQLPGEIPVGPQRSWPCSAPSRWFVLQIIDAEKSIHALRLESLLTPRYNCLKNMSKTKTFSLSSTWLKSWLHFSFSFFFFFFFFLSLFCVFNCFLPYFGSLTIIILRRQAFGKSFLSAKQICQFLHFWFPPPPPTHTPLAWAGKGTNNSYADDDDGVDDDGNVDNGN